VTCRAEVKGEISRRAAWRLTGRLIRFRIVLFSTDTARAFRCQYSRVWRLRAAVSPCCEILVAQVMHSHRSPGAQIERASDACHFWQCKTIHWLLNHACSPRYTFECRLERASTSPNSSHICSGNLERRCRAWITVDILPSSRSQPSE